MPRGSEKTGKRMSRYAEVSSDSVVNKRAWRVGSSRSVLTAMNDSIQGYRETIEVDAGLEWHMQERE
jgi:hypothetical protein